MVDLLADQPFGEMGVLLASLCVFLCEASQTRGSSEDDKSEQLHRPHLQTYKRCETREGRAVAKWNDSDQTYMKNVGKKKKNRTKM